MTSSEAPEQAFRIGVEPTGIVRLTWMRGLRIDGVLAAAAMVAVDELNGDSERPLLVEMAGVDSPTGEAIERSQVPARPCGSRWWVSPWWIACGQPSRRVLSDAGSPCRPGSSGPSPKRWRGCSTGPRISAPRGPRAVDPDRTVRRLLAFLGSAMIATGQPVDEVEEELREVGRAFGAPDVQVAAGPTGLHVGLASGEPAAFESVGGSLRLDQAADVRLIRHQLVDGRIGVEQAIERLTGLRGKPLRYSWWVADLGFVAVAVGICLILQPGVANVVVSAVCGAVVAGVLRVSQRHPALLALLPTVAGFVVSCLVFAAADAGLLVGALRTVLPPLAVLLPGALLVTGLSELAAGAMVAGSSRLLYGTVQLLLFALGIAAAAAVLRTPPAALANVRVAELGVWAAPAGLVVIGVGIALTQSVPVRLTPWVLGVLVLTFLAQSGGQGLGSPALGSFLGAIAASLGATTAELIDRRLPRLVVFLPSFWLLVPGSLGLIGVSELAISPGQGPTGVLEVLAVIGAIATGLLVGSVVSRTVRVLGRRLMKG